MTGERITLQAASSDRSFIWIPPLVRWRQHWRECGFVQSAKLMDIQPSRITDPVHAMNRHRRGAGNMLLAERIPRPGSVRNAG
jgi:hypothetical protein